MWLKTKLRMQAREVLVEHLRDLRARAQLPML